jgi:DNA gyrase subunit B
VDGAHIRTLLLTFLFRQMPQLIENRMVYIAQPPLYEVRSKGKRKSEYVLSESEMRKRMTGWGLAGTELIIRDLQDPQSVQEKMRVTGDELVWLVKTLGDVERAIGVLSRRGIHFLDFIRRYYDGSALPEYLIRVAGEEEVFYDLDPYEKRLEELGAKEEQTEDSVIKDLAAEELNEVTRINQVNAELTERYQLDLRDYLLQQERTVAGEAMITKFQLVNGEDTYEIPSLGDICPGIRQIGGKGIEIKRFKGLGEMNADQLWETTMNPETRTLLSVKLDDAGEADRLFAILMGDDVEKRRNFIRDHALEVTNLDV